MKDANGDAAPQQTSDFTKSNIAAEQAQTTSAAVPASDAKGSESKDKVKLETESKEKQSLVDEDLVRAFRYFDKTGQGCCCQLPCLINNCMGVCCCGATTCTCHSSLVFGVVALLMGFVVCLADFCDLCFDLCMSAWCKMTADVLCVNAGCGYIKTDDMRRVLHNLGLRLSYRQVKDLCAYVAEVTSNTGISRTSRTDRISYRQITHVSADDA